MATVKKGNFEPKQCAKPLKCHKRANKKQTAIRNDKNKINILCLFLCPFVSLTLFTLIHPFFD